MTEQRPPILLPRTKQRSPWMVAGIIACVVMVLGMGAISAFRAIVASGITRGPDVMFGDQNLKTAVALIELHKVRTGRCPRELSELKFTGQWDMMAIQSVRYVASNDGSSYFVEVERGWIGKPKLDMPAEFWHGTGYNPKLGDSR